MDKKPLHFYEYRGLLFPAEEVHGAINHIFEGIAKEFMGKSNNPKAFALRIALMKKNPRNRAKVWRLAIQHLIEKTLTVKKEEIKEKYHVTKIDFSKVGLDNID